MNSFSSDESVSLKVTYNNGAGIWSARYTKAAGKILKHNSYSWKTVIFFGNYNFNFS